MKNNELHNARDAAKPIERITRFPVYVRSRKCLIDSTEIATEIAVYILTYDIRVKPSKCNSIFFYTLIRGFFISRKTHEVEYDSVNMIIN